MWRRSRGYLTVVDPWLDHVPRGHDFNCVHTPFKKLTNWLLFLRQSLYLWLVPMCVSLIEIDELSVKRKTIFPPISNLRKSSTSTKNNSSLTYQLKWKRMFDEITKKKTTDRRRCHRHSHSTDGMKRIDVYFCTISHRLPLHGPWERNSRRCWRRVWDSELLTNFLSFLYWTKFLKSNWLLKICRRRPRWFITHNFQSIGREKWKPTFSFFWRLGSKSVG